MTMEPAPMTTKATLHRASSRWPRRHSTNAANRPLRAQKRCLDFLIDAGANGICILANYSEQSRSPTTSANS